MFLYQRSSRSPGDQRHRTKQHLCRVWCIPRVCGLHGHPTRASKRRGAGSKEAWGGGWNGWAHCTYPLCCCPNNPNQLILVNDFLPPPPLEINLATLSTCGIKTLGDFNLSRADVKQKCRGEAQSEGSEEAILCMWKLVLLNWRSVG